MCKNVLKIKKTFFFGLAMHLYVCVYTLTNTITLNKSWNRIFYNQKKFVLIKCYIPHTLNAINIYLDNRTLLIPL